MSSSHKKTAETSATQQQSATSESAVHYPLFFSSPHVITLERHAQAKLRSDITMEFARNTNSIPLAATDIMEAAKYYPLAFSQGDQIFPVAIVGLEYKNYFIDAQGQWARGYYVPSYVRKYPFVFLETPGDDELTLCIDEPALTRNPDAEGTLLYEDGHPSSFTNNALEFCAAYQEQHKRASEFCQMLKEKNMLAPQRSDIKLANGKTTELGGFQLIDPEKFRLLSEAEAFDWYKRGFLALAYYMMQSHSNWETLLELANQEDGSHPQKA